MMRTYLLGLFRKEGLKMKPRILSAWRQVAIVLAVSSIGGCGLTHQLLSPDLKALKKYRVGTIPDQADLIMLDQPEFTDDDLAMAYRHIKSYRPKRISFQRADVSDNSVSLLIQLDSVRELDLTGTRVTLEGLRRLKMCKSLKLLTIEKGAFTPAQLSELKQHLGDINVEETWPGIHVSCY